MHSSSPNLHYILRVADEHGNSGRFPEAIACYRQALALNSGMPEVWNNLGNALSSIGRLSEAAAVFQQALVLRPDLAEIHYNYAQTLIALHQDDAAIAALQQAVRLKPQFAAAYRNLGGAFKDRGQLEEAIAAYRQAQDLQPADASAGSDLLYLLNFHADYDGPAIARELAQWNRQYTQSLAGQEVPHANDRNPERALRVGYVSPDFYLHAECFFVVPLLEGHDPRRFEVHCYSSTLQGDIVTERQQRAASVWHDVRGLTDEQLAARIRADGIDILVDLSMHMGNHRLLTFARRPAPVQVIYLAYPGSTGLAAMDYRISDDVIDPPALDASCYTEQTVRLPDCWCCFDPLTEMPPAAARVESWKGPVTYGCLNNPCKINRELLRLWGQVLGAVEGSRLLLRVLSEYQRQQVRDELGRCGIAADRITFAGYYRRGEYLRLHDHMDVALDTLPYNGITTTCDALWMGVPVVSLTGRTGASRAGKSLLGCVELPELACESPEQFVKVAADLGRDFDRLRILRGGLRERLTGSPLMDRRRFAGHMEAAYREMWRRWCAQRR